MTDQPDPETLHRMEQALRRMPRRQRELFLAARCDALTYAEIAERTGLSIREVERELAKAFASYARRLEPRPRRWWRRR